MGVKSSRRAVPHSKPEGLATFTPRTLSIVLAALAAAATQTALGADAFHGNLTATGNQANPAEVIPGTQVQITVADNPQTYNTTGQGQSVTLCQLNWSVTSGAGLDLTTGSPWTWDNTLLAGWEPEYIFFYDPPLAGERAVARRAFHLVGTLVGIQAPQFTLGTLSFAAPSYGASNAYTISLAGGTDAAGTTTALGDGDYYALQSNGRLTVPAAYQFTVIPGGAWRASSSNHWETGTNWSGGGVPDSTYTALFDAVSPAPATPVLYKNESVKALRLETPNAGVTVGTSSGSWRLSVGTGGINSTGTGTNTVNAGVNFSTNGAVNVGTGNILSIAGGADIGGHTVSKTGPGTLVLGAQTHTAASTLNVNQGTVKFDGTQRLDTLNANAGLAQITPGNGKVLVLNSLSVAPSATLDLTDNDMIIKYSGGTPHVPTAALENVKHLVSMGYNSMTWTGPGLTSSTAAALPLRLGIGYAQNDMLFAPYSTFAGEPVTSAVLVKFTYLGDMNLDGVVDDNDVAILGLYYDGGARNTHYWNEGDVFGYDGRIDDNDVSIFGLTYGAGFPPNGSPLAGGGVTAVPEPATLALVGLGALAFLGRRTRK